MYEPWFKINNLTIDFSADIKYLNTIDAAEKTVKSIMENFPAPYRLMVSGGVDSQAMLYVWKLFGKNFIPTSITYNGDYNDHDICTLREFAQKENIEIEYHNFDLLGFYQTRFFKIAEKYQCVSPQFAAHIGMIESLDGTCIFSGDRLEPNSALINSRNICVLNASKEMQIVPYFFMHTPELSYSLIYEHLTPEVINLHAGKDYHDYPKKVNYLQKSGIPVIAQLTKYTGFEKIRDYYDNTYRHLLTPVVRMKYYKHYPHFCMFDILLRYPYEDKFIVSFDHVINNVHS